MNRPIIICLCGSTRFYEVFDEVNLRETLAGNIVLSIGSHTQSDDCLLAAKTSAECRLMKSRLDVLHLHKIDLCHEILVINVGGYIGESTGREIEYAMSKGKTIRYLEHDIQEGE